MEKTYGTLLRLILFTALPLFAQMAKSGTAAELYNFAFPEFSKSDGRLEYILYGKKAVNLGAQVTLTRPIIDLMQKSVTDINKVVSVAGVLPYPLLASRSMVNEFWKDKQHSQLIIFATHAVYDKNARMLKSSTPVFFRSPEISMDGVGFDVDLDRKFIHIRQRVRVCILPKNKTTGSNRSIVKKEKKP